MKAIDDAKAPQMTEIENASIAPRRVAAGRGADWWGEAWNIFKRAPVIWIAFGLITIVLMLICSRLPIVGGLATVVLGPAWLGGWMLAARKAERGEPLNFGDLLAGFRKPVRPLLTLGVLSLAAWIVVTLIAGAMGLGAVVAMFWSGAAELSVDSDAVGPAALVAALGAGMLGLLVGLALALLITMALWFAPALIVFDNVAPVDALRISFAAGAKNVVPFLVYSVLSVGLALVASLLLGLGWLVLIPLGIITIYVSYRDIYAR